MPRRRRRRCIPLLCLAGLLGSAPLAAQQRPAPAPRGEPEAIAVQATSDLPALPGDQLAASVAWLLGEWYGQHVTGRPAPGSLAGPRWRLQLSVTAGRHGVQLRSELTAPGGAAATRDAWLPPGSLGALTATAAADGFWLWSQARQFPYLAELAPAPLRSAVLQPQALSRLSGQPLAATAVSAAAAYPGGVLALLPDGPLALGTRFEITPDTVLWLTWRELAPPGTWRSIYPLADGRVVLEPSAGPPVLVEPHHDTSTALSGAPLPAASRGPSPPPATLLAVAPSGAAVWHSAGFLTVQQPTDTGSAAASIELPVGSIASAAAAGDGSGAVWAFDPRERRIRVFAPGGDGTALRQLFAVTPLVPREELTGVQTLALSADGHLLVGSRRGIWKLDRRGMPLWSLRLLNTRPRQRLPQAFAVTAQVDEAAFLLLDRTTGVLHRFDEQPPPPPDRSPILLPADGSPPAAGAIAGALTDNALRAAEQAWQRHYPTAAHRLLAAARRYLSRWRAADPLARGADRRAAAIETFGDSVERALYGQPLFALQIAPQQYHPALLTYYRDHPFVVTLHNRSGRTVQSVVELGVAGAVRSTTLNSPTLAAGASATLPVPLYPASSHGATDLPQEVSLWLRATPAEGAPAVLARTSLILAARRCLPVEAAARAGAARAAFLGWHLDTPNSALAALAAMPLTPHDLVNAVARLGAVTGAGPSCSVQPVAHTLASLSGTVTDWTLALGALLARRGVPTTLLLSDEPPSIVLMHPEGVADTAFPPDAALDEAARRQLNAATAGRQLEAGPIWALLPLPGAAGSGSAAAWLAAGARRAAAALQPGAGSWRLVTIPTTGEPYGRTEHAVNRTAAWPVVLPLGASAP